MNKIKGYTPQLTLAGRLKDMAGGWSAGLLLVMFAYYSVFNMTLLRKQKQLPSRSH